MANKVSQSVKQTDSIDPQLLLPYKCLDLQCRMVDEVTRRVDGKPLYEQYNNGKWTSFNIEDISPYYLLVAINVDSRTICQNIEDILSTNYRHVSTGTINYFYFVNKCVSYDAIYWGNNLHNNVVAKLPKWTSFNLSSLNYPIIFGVHITYNELMMNKGLNESYKITRISNETQSRHGYMYDYYILDIKGRMTKAAVNVKK